MPYVPGVYIVTWLGLRCRDRVDESETLQELCKTTQEWLLRMVLSVWTFH